jgi:excisionase family DNA binding protein
MSDRSQTLIEEKVPNLHMLSTAEVCSMLKIHRDTLWRMRRAGRFPAPITIGHSHPRWLFTDLQAWVARKGSGTAAS